jgi:hypothetical protein
MKHLYTLVLHLGDEENNRTSETGGRRNWWPAKLVAGEAGPHTLASNFRIEYQKRIFQNLSTNTSITYDT